MRKILIGFAVVILTVLGAATAVFAGGFGSPATGSIQICHATGSQTNPFVYIGPDASGVAAGHSKHSDDIFAAFKYENSHGYEVNVPAQNLDTLYNGVKGSILLANHCVPPPPNVTTVTTPVTTTVPGPTTTVTTTVTNPVTTTVTTPAVTVTNPTSTVTLPSTTVTTPAVTLPVVTVTNGSTVTLPEKTVTVTKTVPVTVTKVSTRTVVKKVKVPVKCVPKKKHLKHHRVKLVSHQRPRLAG